MSRAVSIGLKVINAMLEGCTQLDYYNRHLEPNKKCLLTFKVDQGGKGQLRGIFAEVWQLNSSLRLLFLYLFL